MYGETKHSPLSTQIFDGCDSDDISSIEKSTRVLCFKKGEYIFREAEPARGVFCLCKGAVKLVKMDAQRNDKILSLAKEGDLLGLRAVIDQANFSSSAVAIVDCRCCFVPQESVYQIIEKYPSINIKMMSALCKEINDIEEKIAIINIKDVPKRVAEILLLLAHDYGLSKDRSLKITPSWDDIADMANIKSSTLMRALHELRHKGVIDIQKKKIKIFNPDLLEEMADVSHQ